MNVKTVENDRIYKLTRTSKPFILQLYGETARLETLFLGNQWKFSIQDYTQKHAEYSYPTLGHALNDFINDLVRSINLKKRNATLKLFALK